jgi:predicted dehydrogenase
VADPAVQAVSIATPDFAHGDPAIAAAKAGKHLLVEKPLATTVEECEAIIAAAKASGVKLMTDFHNRWSPPFYKAWKALREGEIGQVSHVYFRLSDTIYVPTKMLHWARQSTVAWFIGSHALDTVCWLLHELPRRVYAVSQSRVLKAKGVDTPDLYSSVLEFPSGATAVIENDWILPETAPNIIDLKCQIVGDQGAIYVDGSHHRMMEKYTQEEGAFPDTFIFPKVQDRQVGFAVESIRHWIECLIKDTRPAVGGEEGLRVTKLILAIEESASTREPVAIGW